MKKSIIITYLFALLLTVSAIAQKERESISDKFGNQLSIQMNDKMGSAHRVYGNLPNINAFDFQRDELNQATVRNLSSKFFSEYKDILKIDPNLIKFRKADTDGHSWFILYWQAVNDIPVHGTQIGYTVNQTGEIIALGADAYNNIEVSTRPKISNVEAQSIASAEFASDSIEVLDSGSLFIYPKETNVTDFYLTWRVRLRSENPNTDKTYFVDATDGNIVEEFNNVTSHTSHNISGEEKEISLAEEVVNSNTDNANVQGENQEQSYHIYGTVSGSYYPEHHYDTPVSTNFEIDGGIKIYNYAGQAIYWNINANSNGYYSANTSQAIYGLKVPVRNDWVRVRRFSNGTTSTVNSYYSISPSSTVEKNVDFGAGDASNVRYHVNKVHDYFKNTFGYSGMDYQMNAKIKEGPNENGWSNGTNIGFGSLYGQEWARSSDVIYHEYSHNVTRKIYDGFVGGSQSTHMDEGLSDYFASTINNDADHGESVGVNRELDNTYSYNSTRDLWWNGQVIGGAAWDVREAVGATIADQLVFKAIQMSPKAHNMADFMQNMMDADQNYYSGAHADEIIDAAENHGIQAPTYLLPPPSVTISGPTDLDVDEVGYWSSSVSGGSAPYSYTWYKTYQMGSPFIVSTSSAYSGSDDQSFTLTLEVTYPNSDIGSDTEMITVTGDCGGGMGICKEVNTVKEFPQEFTFGKNYPNPFNPSTQIKYALPEAAEVSIKVYNIMGQQVAVLVNTNKSAGFHEVNFDAGSLSSGVYIARMEAVGESGELFSDELKMQLIK